MTFCFWLTYILWMVRLMKSNKFDYVQQTLLYAKVVNSKHVSCSKDQIIVISYGPYKWHQKTKWLRIGSYLMFLTVGFIYLFCFVSFVFILNIDFSFKKIYLNAIFPEKIWCNFSYKNLFQNAGIMHASKLWSFVNSINFWKKENSSHKHFFWE